MTDRRLYFIRADRHTFWTVRDLNDMGWMSRGSWFRFHSLDAARAWAATVSSALILRYEADSYGTITATPEALHD